MKNLHYGHCLIGIAIAVVALIAFGVSASTLALVGIVAACPIMMFIMMRTMMVGNQNGAPPDNSVPADKPVKQDRHQ